MLIDALAKFTADAPAIMPERLALTDPFRQLPEVIGSGPFRLYRRSRVAGRGN
jgi:peptide/nickel transport system substrate-binding protein